MKSGSDGRRSLKALLADYISAVSSLEEVTCILAKDEGQRVAVWAVLSKGDREAQQSIYEEEMKAMARLEDLEFDFHTVVLRGRSMAAVLPADARLLFSR